MTYARWIHKWRREILAVAALLGILGAFLASRLELRTDFSHLLPPSERSVRDLRAVELRAQALGNLLIGVVADDPAQRQRAAKILHERLSALPPSLVTRVTLDDGLLREHILAHRFLFAPLGDLQRAHGAILDLIAQAKLKANPAYISFEDEEPAGVESAELAELKARLKEAEDKAKSPSPIVSKDGKTQLLVVTAAFPSADVPRGKKLAAAVRAALDETRRLVSPNVSMGAAGDVITAVIEHRAVLSGMVVATLLTVSLVCVGLVLYYRSILGVGAVLFTLGIGTLVTFGVTTLAIGHLNSATAFLASIVIGNGINFPMILLARFLEEFRKGKRGLWPLAVAIQGTARGTLAAALAAGVAYASLIVTDFRGFRHFGVIGGIGMAFCWLAAYTVLPAALSVLEGTGRIRARAEPGLGPLLARLLPKRMGIVVALGLLATMGSGLATWKYLDSDPFEYDFSKLRSTGPEAREARAWMDRLDKAFGRGIAGGFVVAVEKREDAPRVAALLRAQIHPQGSGGALLGQVGSLDDFIPKDQPEKLALLAEIRGLFGQDTLSMLSETEQAEIRRLMPPENLAEVTDADVPVALGQKFIERDGTRGRLIFANHGPDVSSWDGRQVIGLVDTVRALPLPEGTRVAGSGFVFADMLKAIERDGPRATLAALLGVGLFTGLVFGLKRHGLVTLGCALLGTLAMLAIAWLVRIKVNFLDFIALPITLGIGVDYTVNVVARERVEGAGSARRALATTGGAVFLCSYTTVVGYGSLLLSENSGIRSFGLAAILGEITCLCAALLVAPALLHVFSGREKSEPDRSEDSLQMETAPPERASHDTVAS